MLVLCVAVGCASNRLKIPPVTVAPAGADSVDMTVLLVGDAGEATPGNPVLSALRREAGRNPNHTVIVYLGDNVYPHGLSPANAPDREAEERHLLAELRPAVETGTRAVFIPGNHDWDHSGRDGWNAVRRQEAFLESRSNGLASYLPGGGCPGPVVEDLGETVRLIALDTQWFLHAYDRPVPPESGCETDTVAEVTAALTRAVAESGHRVAIVVAHHPLRSSGPHGGYFPWEDHLFPLRRVAGWLWIPLPFVGSLYPAARNLGISRQDVSNGTYRRMRDELEAALAAAPPRIYASGHDHSLQVMRLPSGVYYLVSGAGPSTGLNPTGWRDETRFARGHPGFMRVEVSVGGAVRLGVIEVAGAETTEVYSEWLPAGLP